MMLGDSWGAVSRVVTSARTVAAGSVAGSQASSGSASSVEPQSVWWTTASSHQGPSGVLVYVR
jgi:hypothetical protein